MKILQENIIRLKQLCKENHVRSLFAFGSVTRDDFNSASDIDLIVDIEEKDPLTYSDYYFNLKFQLEQLLNRPIDLLEERAIKNEVLRKHLDKNKVLIYG